MEGVSVAWLPSEFRVDVVPEGSSMVVRAVGEVDFATATSLQAALEVAVTGAQDVVVDMARVTFIDVAGITALVSAASLARAHGAELVIRNLGTTARRVFEILEVSRHVPIQEAEVTPALAMTPGVEGHKRDARNDRDRTLATDISTAIAS